MAAGNQAGSGGYEDRPADATWAPASRTAAWPESDPERDPGSDPESDPERDLTAPGAHGADHSLARRYRELLDRVPALVYIAEPGELGRWLFVGAQIDAILGFSAEEWCARPELWPERLHPDDRAAALERERAMERRGGGAFTDEYRMIHRDGHVVWLRDDARLLREPDGRLFWRGVMVDVTAYKTLGARLQLQSERQAAVATLGERALEGMPEDQLCRAAVASACSLLGADEAVIAHLVDGGRSLQPRCFHPPRDGAEPGPTASGPDTAAGQALLARAPVIVRDWDSERRFHRPESWRDWRSTACVALDGPRQQFGVMSVHCRTPRSFEADELSFLQGLANVLADALDRRATEDEIRHRAVHDPLTGLPNRVLLEDRLGHALAGARRRGETIALLFLDLDHFKLINDSLGHQAGDQVLVAVATQLQRTLRTSETVARLGGDEFALLIEQIHGAEDAIAVAERIRQLFAAPLTIGAREHFVNFSIGIALAGGAEDAGEMIRNADVAMYRAKERGRGQFAFFDRTMRKQLLLRLRLENELRHALEREELTLEYQPVVATGDRSLKGVEALLRWDSRHFGRMNPSDFVALAEQNGLIEPIWLWVLETACMQAAEWASLTGGATAVNVAINLSPVQISSPTLTGSVRDALRRCGLAPERLCIELTETAMVHEPGAANAVLRELSAVGVRFALDDFGTGFSSLAYLSQLHLDVLKIDRAFVGSLGANGRDDAIVTAIVSMAQALSLEVIAEGVETPEQARILRELGCELGQGYLYSRPLPATQITSLLQQAPPWKLATGV